MSSTFHFISGDGEPSNIRKYICRINQKIEHTIYNSSLPGEDYSACYPNLDLKKLSNLFGDDILNSSPSRILSYDFLAENGISVFGSGASIVDLGCGKGNYSEHLAKVINFKSYLGCDLASRDEWKNYARENVNFTKRTLGIDNIDVSSYNSVFSQSVLEHVRFDKEAFEKLTAHRGHTLNHMHFVPALPSWSEYKYHGYRRYSLSIIQKLLSGINVTDLRIIGIGNSLTRDFFREQRLPRYQKANYETKADHVPFEKGISMAENLKRQKELIVPNHAGDASFFVITFCQKF